MQPRWQRRRGTTAETQSRLDGGSARASRALASRALLRAGAAGGAGDVRGALLVAGAAVGDGVVTDAHATIARHDRTLDARVAGVAGHPVAAHAVLARALHRAHAAVAADAALHVHHEGLDAHRVDLLA